MRTGALLMLCQLVETVQSSTINPREDTSQTQDHIILLVHASTAVLAWAFFFPLGSILLRLIESKNAIWIHVSIQFFATLIYTVAVGTGIHIAEKYRVLDEYHPIHGLLIFALMFVQIAGGILHHLFFRRYLRRTVISHVHIWLGRILVTTGIVNGGLGLLIAYRRPTVGQIIAYAVVAGIIWLVFIGVGWRKGPNKRKETEKRDRYGDRSKIMEKRERRVSDLGPPRRRERARLLERDRLREPEKVFLVSHS